MSKETFIPLSELTDKPNGRIVWELVVPEYAPSGNIGVSTSRLSRLACLGGFRHISIRGYSGNTTTEVPEVDSVDAFGVATASGRSTITKAERQQSYVSQPEPLDEEFLHYDYYWADGTISLNMAEIDDHIGEQRKLRDAPTWSAELDKAIKLGIRNVSRQNLLENPHPIHKLNLAVFPAIIAAELSFLGHLVGFPYPKLGVPECLPLGLFAFQAGDVQLAKKRGLDFKDRRLSLFGGWQPDRAIAVNGLSRALRIVKPI